jgi:HEPN domain-containing protein
MKELTPDIIRARRIASFLALAERDLLGAKTMLQLVPEHAAYCLQQTVEKLVRAVLEFDEVPAGPTHNIRSLADLLASGHVLHADVLAFDSLSSASTRYHYPSETGELRSISAARLESFFPKLEKLQQDINAYLQRPKASPGA